MCYHIYDRSERTVMINNEYDFSNLIPTIENILPLVKYCNSVYDEFIRLCAEDAEKNERLKKEYKRYQYFKMVGTDFKIYVRGKLLYQSTNCLDYNHFMNMVKTNQITNIRSLKISLILNYKSGNYDNFEEHLNSFEINFEPYNIKFIRNSNYMEYNMAKIEANIYNYLTSVETKNTIFCSK